MAQNNSVVNNSVTSAVGAGIWIRAVASGTTVRDNAVTDTGKGIVVFANESAIRNNIVDDTQPANDPTGGDGIVIVARSVILSENTVTRAEDGVVVAGKNAIIRNSTLDSNMGAGLQFTGGFAWPGYGTGIVVDNQVTNNNLDGIDVGSDFPPSEYEVHRNRIQNNGRFGIRIGNSSKIVDARNNIWGCGGPSSGLRDPYTGRVADGSGDQITAGDEPGVSNVRFDPFQVVDSCPALTATSTPPATAQSTPTPSPTPTPTVSATPTSTPTPTPTQGILPTGDSGEYGTDGSNAARNNGSEGAPDSATTTSVNPTQTARPTATPSATVTVSPTPRVEPGFGIAVWFIALSVFVTLLAYRRPRQTDRGDRR